MSRRLSNAANVTSTDQRWTARQRHVIEWLALPRRSREPSTQEELAAEIGVTAQTISQWKRLPGFQQAVLQRARRALGYRLPDILGKLGDLAEGGSLGAIVVGWVCDTTLLAFGVAVGLALLFVSRPSRLERTL